MVSTLFSQIVVMALLMGVGALLVKKNMLSAQGCRDLGVILLNVVIPCVILKSYMIEFSVEKLKGLGISALLSFLSLVLAMLISWLFFGKKKGIQNFAASFGNAGFIGIPLTQAVFGEEAVFYVAAYVALLNMFQWTYGLYIMTGDTKVIRPGTILKNPVLLSIILGIGAFLLPVSIPSVITKTIGFIGGMNTPLAMIILGSYMTKTDVKSLFFARETYSCTFLRLVIIPVITLAVFMAIPAENKVAVMTVLIAAATSTGGNIAIFAQQYKQDYILAVKTVCLSTVLSLITIPTFFWGMERVFIQ